MPSGLPPVERRAVLPAGFAAGATTAGIKATGRPDLALVHATGGPAAAAAVFTPNPFAAAPVAASRANLAITRPEGRGDGGDHYGRAQAIVSTSGCANAATGPAGHADQVAIAHAVAGATCTPTRRASCSLSTGVIGTRLPLAKVVAGLATLAGNGLGADDAAFAAVAEALRTTDSVTKAATDPRRPARARRNARPRSPSSGIAKGVGMIHPRMATMLAVVLTDAAVEPGHAARPPAGRARGPGTSSPSTATRARTTRSSCSPPGRRRPRRSPPARRRRRRSAPRSRRSPATSPASRPPTARARRRSSPAR